MVTESGTQQVVHLLLVVYWWCSVGTPTAIPRIPLPSRGHRYYVGGTQVVVYWWSSGGLLVVVYRWCVTPHM
jgi:hypothetical protein